MDRNKNKYKIFNFLTSGDLSDMPELADDDSDADFEKF